MYDLLKGRLQFSAISTFNDPFEARPRYVPVSDNAGEQREAIIRYLADISPGGGSGTARRKWAEEAIRGKSMREIVETHERNSRGEHWIATTQVLCLMTSQAATKPLAWAHYADGHRGICAHLRTDIGPLRFAYPVDYQQEYPEVPVPRTAIDQWELVRRILLRKSPDWSYEHEHRVIRIMLSDAGASHHLMTEWDGDVAIAPKDIVTAVTVGCRMRVADRERLMAWIKANTPHIEVWQATLHDSRYELGRERIA